MNLSHNAAIGLILTLAEKFPDGFTVDNASPALSHGAAYRACLALVRTGRLQVIGKKQVGTRKRDVHVYGKAWK